MGIVALLPIQRGLDPFAGKRSGNKDDLPVEASDAVSAVRNVGHGEIEANLILANHPVYRHFRSGMLKVHLGVGLIMHDQLRLARARSRTACRARPHGRKAFGYDWRGSLRSAKRDPREEKVAEAPVLPQLDFSTIGPRVGERLPDIVLPDQHGTIVDVHASRGTRRAVLVFYRSASW